MESEDRLRALARRSPDGRGEVAVVVLIEGDRHTGGNDLVHHLLERSVVHDRSTTLAELTLDHDRRRAPLLLLGAPLKLDLEPIIHESAQGKSRTGRIELN